MTLELIAEHDLLIGGGPHLDIWRVTSGMDTRVFVCYAGAEVKDGLALVSEVGIGGSINEAANDYYQKIRGKTLVLDANRESRYEIIVI